VSTKKKVRTITLKVPSLKLATERLKRLKQLEDWIFDCYGGHTYPKKPAWANDFISKERLNADRIVKAIKKKQAIIDDLIGKED
jgi:hypothetical protein